MGVWLIFRPKYVALRENVAAGNVPDPLVLRDIDVQPVNDYPAESFSLDASVFMSEKKPIPAVAGPTPRVCPVCGKASYSRSGIHPQCAATQADKSRRQRLAAAKEANTVQRRDET